MRRTSRLFVSHGEQRRCVCARFASQSSEGAEEVKVTPNEMLQSRLRSPESGT